MNALDCARYLGGKVVETVDLPAEPAPVYCCLVAWCNGVVEAAEDMEEFDRMTTDAEHVRLRYEILEHICEKGGT